MRKPLSIDFDPSLSMFHVFVARIQRFKAGEEVWELMPEFFPTMGHAQHHYQCFIRGDWKTTEKHDGIYGDLKNTCPLGNTTVRITQLYCPEWIDEEEDSQCAQSSESRGTERGPQRTQRK